MHARRHLRKTQIASIMSLWPLVFLAFVFCSFCAAHIWSICELTAGELWIFSCELKRMSHANVPAGKHSRRMKKKQERTAAPYVFRICHDSQTVPLDFVLLPLCRVFRLDNWIENDFIHPLLQFSSTKCDSDLEKTHSPTHVLVHTHLIDGTWFQVHAKSDLNNVNESQSRKSDFPLSRACRQLHNRHFLCSRSLLIQCN